MLKRQQTLLKLCVVDDLHQSSRGTYFSCIIDDTTKVWQRYPHRSAISSWNGERVRIDGHTVFCVRSECAKLHVYMAHFLSSSAFIQNICPCDRTCAVSTWISRRSTILLLSSLLYRLLIIFIFSEDATLRKWLAARRGQICTSINSTTLTELRRS